MLSTIGDAIGLSLAFLLIVGRKGIDMQISKKLFLWVLGAFSKVINSFKRDTPVTKIVQLVDNEKKGIGGERAFAMDETGNSHYPVDDGMIGVRPGGIISIMDTKTREVIQVEYIPKNGPSPHRVVVALVTNGDAK